MTTEYPPGPRLPRVVQTLMFAQWYGRFLRAQALRYGDVFTVRMLPPFPRNMVVVSRPEHVREIYAADAADLHGGKEWLAPILGKHSLPVAEETEHARARRMLMPAFVRSALSEYRDTVQIIAKEHVDSWETGSTLSMLDHMEALTLEVIMRVVFGVTDKQLSDRLIDALDPIVNAHPVVFVGWKPPVLRRYGPWKRLHDSQIELDNLLRDEIANRRAQPDLERRGDVLSRMLAVGSTDDRDDEPLSYSELRDHLITMLLAGHETTASTLAWAFHELATAPEIQARAHQAAQNGDDKYLEAVVKETMRRRPVAGEARRQLTRDMMICGFHLPQGTYVSTSIELAHQRTDTHRQPDRFLPERFLDGEVAADTWLPFGGGARRCLGAGFSLMEGAAVLREVLSRFTIALPPNSTPDHGTYRNITYVPANGGRVVLSASPSPR